MGGIVVAEGPGADSAIAALPTAVTAFVGRTLRGPVNRPVTLRSFAEFHQVFGGLWQPSPLSYAVEQFFEHGGEQAALGAEVVVDEGVRDVRGRGDVAHRDVAVPAPREETLGGAQDALRVVTRRRVVLASRSGLRQDRRLLPSRAMRSTTGQVGAPAPEHGSGA